MSSDQADASPTTSPRGGRRLALTAVAIAAFAGAGVLTVAGVRAGQGDDPVLITQDARTSSPPSTVAPRERAEVSDQPAVSTSATTTTADAEGGSAVVTEPPAEPEAPKVPPVGLNISTIDVGRYPVRAVGLQENGQLEVPDETEIGWYKYGATAGRPGATVLAAHVNWRGSRGPFANLDTVEPGDQIEVALQDGTTRTYEVTERTMYGKLMLPRERIWRNSGPEELVLITCGGEFNPEIRSYKSNIVVYAVPIG